MKITTQMMRKSSHPFRQRGLSIIEFMIGVALSVVMVAGAAEIMLGTKRTYSVNDEHSRVQENGRIALDLLVDGIRNAGYGGWTGVDPRMVLGMDNAGVWISCGGVQCTQDEVALANGLMSDSLTVVGRSVNGTDCTGTATPTEVITHPGGQTETVNAVIAQRYWVAPSVAGVSALYCQGFVETAAGWVANGGGGPQPLVDGIDSLQVLYGIDAVTPNDATTYGVDRFVSAPSVNITEWKPGAGAQITGVRVALVASNGQAAGTLDSKSRSYQLFNNNAMATITDTRLRQVYTTTVSFTNATMSL